MQSRFAELVLLAVKSSSSDVPFKSFTLTVYAPALPQLTLGRSDTLADVQVSLARLTTAAQFGMIGVAVFGDQIFPYLDMEPPALYVANRDRRVSVCLGTRSHVTCIEVFCGILSAGQRVTWRPA